MIKTLRITGVIAVIAAILAAVFFVFPAFFGVRGDEQIEKFLDSAGAIEKFSKAKGEKSASSKSQVSPLVKQAEAFALYLNPPSKPRPRKTAITRKEPIVPREPRPLGSVSAKFNLISTSFCALHPELSLALIDEPGKGQHWVRQAASVGHLVVEQVKDGLVVVRDGQRTFELPVAERPPKRSLLEGAAPARAETGFKPTLRTLGEGTSSFDKQEDGTKPAARDSTLRQPGVAGKGPPQPSVEEATALMEKFINNFDAMSATEQTKGPIRYDKTDSTHKVEKSRELMEKVLSDLQNMRISGEEAKRLDHLGKDLKDVRARRLPNNADRDTRGDPKRAKIRRVERPKKSPTK